ncbi:MAG TPA: hypothetical protein VN445_02290 [Rectinemataceae bacterium]|nr:hypothetical protein [Rectinemataceae bacterium]
MKRFLRLAVFTALALATLTGTYAQQASTSKSVSIQLVAVVPAMLKLSLDFSTDTTIQLSGYIPGNETYSGNIRSARSEGSRFEIKSGSTIDLGNARLFSNLRSSYSVNVYSANGGSLRDPSGADSAAIPYQVCLGNTTTSARGGTFSFAGPGMSTTMEGSSLRVALVINNVPQTASSGFYSDQLMFSVSAN